MSGLPSDLGALTPQQLARLHAQLRRKAEARKVPAIPRCGRSGPCAVSFAQERLWFMDQLAPGNPAYNLSEALRIRGALNITALQAAFAAVIARQHGLRTSFVEVDGRPTQRVHEVREVEGWRLRVIRLDGLAESERSVELRRLVDREGSHHFDLRTPPLFRALLVRMTNDEHVLILTFHHIIADGWSFTVLVEEVSALYAGQATGAPIRLPELPVQYLDFAEWQRTHLSGERLAVMLGHWRDRLAGAPPVLTLAGSRPRPPQQSYRGAHRTFRVPDADTVRLAELWRRVGATSFMTLVTAFMVVLRHRSGRDDIVVGTDVANRSRRETERLVGYFVNQLVLRADLSGDPGFAALLRDVRGRVLDAYDHQDLPFQTLVAELAQGRGLDANPLFQVLFVQQDRALRDGRLHDLELASVTLDSETHTTVFDVSVHAFATAERIEGLVRYSTDLFDERFVTELIEDYLTVLHEIAECKDTALSDLTRAVERAASERAAGEASRTREAALRTLRTGRRRVVGGAGSEMPGMER